MNKLWECVRKEMKAWEVCEGRMMRGCEGRDLI
jgi:hypothetical protein